MIYRGYLALTIGDIVHDETLARLVSHWLFLPLPASYLDLVLGSSSDIFRAVEWVACSAWQPPHEDSLLPFHASSGSTQVENSHRLYRTSSSTWHQVIYSRHRSGAIRLTIVLALKVKWTTQTAFRQIRAYLDWSYCIVYSWCCHRKVQASPNQQRTNRLFSGWVYFTVLIP